MVDWKICIDSMIIGLSGYAQSGKDTVANILVKQYGFTRVAFADKIRQLAQEVNPLVGEGIHLNDILNDYGWDVAKQNFYVRQFLQQLGVGARNLFGDTFWIKEALKPLELNGDFVFTDVRFVNEADIIRSNNGYIWRIKRPGIEAVNNHVSEHDLDWYKVDQILSNRGTVEELELLVQQRMDNIRANKVT
jgi:cytidylate kinase